MKKKRKKNSVTFIIGQLVLGGAEKQLYLLVRGLMQRGWDVSVITLHPGHNDYWEVPIKEMGVRFFGIVDHGRLLRFIRLIFILRRERTSIVHSWTEFTGLYASVCGRLACVPIRLGSQRSNERYTIQVLGKFLYKLSYFGLDGVVTNSRPALTQLSNRWPSLDVCFIPNGVESPVGHTKENICRKYSIPLEKSVIGAIGALISVKRFDILIDAVSLLQQTGINCCLVLVGDGPLRDQLFLRASKKLDKGSLFLLGAIPQAENILPAFDVFCFTSENEGTPNVVLEALANGIPVVSTAVGGVGELIEHGVSGILINSNTPEGVADLIQHLLLNPSLMNEISNKGRLKTLELYSVDNMVESMIQFYEKKIATDSINNHK